MDRRQRAGSRAVRHISGKPFAGGRSSFGPGTGAGLTALLSIMGGVWFPITNGFLHTLARALQSYWLVQASHVASGGHTWGALGWFVTAWTIALGVPAAWAYRRDTQRV